MLLVLDNFEQVVEAAPEVATIISAAPRLRVLVTSRAPLRLRDEQELLVQPFPLPDGANSMDATRNPAVRLFTERAQAVLPSFALTPHWAGAVADICRRLDGLPLAIELAAARAKIMSPPALLERLADGTELLSPGFRDAPQRQQSLRSTLTWSYDLLKPEEQLLFRRLAVFSRGWTLDAAEAIWAGPPFSGTDVLTLLAALVDHSLIVVREQAAAEPRFTMLETVREFALAQLEHSGEAPHVRERHADWFLELAEQAQPRLDGREAAELFAALEQEHDNFRAALTWADGQPSRGLGLRLAAALARFWFIRGHYAEGQHWIERFLHCAGTDTDTVVRTRALEGVAALVYNQGEYRRAAELFEQATEGYRQAFDESGVGRTLTGLGGVLRDHGNRARAVAVLEESVALWRTLPDQQGFANALVNLGTAVYMAGDVGRAEALIDEGVALQRELQSEAGLIFSLRYLGQLLAERGDYDAATKAVEESLELSRRVGDRGGTGAAITLLAHLTRDRGDLDRARALFHESLSNARVRMGLAFTLEGLAGVEAELAQPRRAARLLGAAAALRGPGEPPPSYVTRHRERYRRSIEAALGIEAFAAGQRMSVEEILATALREH